MKPENKYLIETVGAIAVVQSLLFLVFQIQQTNRIARVTTEYEIRNNFSGINETLMTDPQLASLLNKGNNSEIDDLSVEEIMVLGSWCGRLISGWIAIELAYREDMVSPETYSITIEYCLGFFWVRFPHLLE